MTSPLLVLGLGPEAAAMAARAKQCWAFFAGARGEVLAIGAGATGALDEHDVAPLERGGQDLPKAAIATALAGLGSPPDVFIVADLAEAEARFLEALAAEMRRALGPDRVISALLVLPDAAAPLTVREAAGEALAPLWPLPGAGSPLDRLFLVEEATEAGRTAARESVREAVALRLVVEGGVGASRNAVGGRSEALTGPVRSLGGVALRYPSRAVADMAAGRIAAALVEGWCGSASQAAVDLPGDLPLDEDSLDFAVLTPEAEAELEAYLDELLWSARARFPQLRALAAAFPAELAALEEAQFMARQAMAAGDDAADSPDMPHSVLEHARDRLENRVTAWHEGIESELAARCRPVFLEGGGLARGRAFLEALGAAFGTMGDTIAERRRLAEERQAEAGRRLEAAIADLAAAARRTLFRNQAGTLKLSECRRAAVLYLVTRAERALLDDFRAAVGRLDGVVGELRERIARTTGVLTDVQHGLEARAAAAVETWHGPNLLDPGDPETAYRDAVGPLPDEEALLASLHDDFVAGGSVLDLPIQPGDEPHLIERFVERGRLLFPELLETTFGQGMAQRLGSIAVRAERLALGLDAATPLLRLATGPDGALPGKTGVVLGHEPIPPQALKDALERLGFPAEDCTELPKKLADHLVIWTERGDIPPEAIVALKSLPGSWPARAQAASALPEEESS